MIQFLKASISFEIEAFSVDNNIHKEHLTLVLLTFYFNLVCFLNLTAH